MRIKRCEVLFYDICELGDLHRSVIEQRLPFSNYILQRTLSDIFQENVLRAIHYDGCWPNGWFMQENIRSANLPSFSIVAVMPLPISAAFLANSDLAPLFDL